MLRFKNAELRPVLEEALANRCQLILVKDDGVYWMSATGERDGRGTREKLAYAMGCNPRVDGFEQWWNAARREFGGDDFGEPFDPGDPVFRRILESTDDLIVRANSTHIEIRTALALRDGQEQGSSQSAKGILRIL